MSVDLSTLWIPEKTQQKFFDAIVACPPMGMVAYVGSFGSGKTWALCRATIGLAYQYPGIRILLGRFHSTDLRDTTQAEFFNLINELEAQVRKDFNVPEGQDTVIGTYHKVPNVYEFSNGSEVMFRSLKDAVKKYKSLNIGAYGIDEASEVVEDAVRMLQSRTRQQGMPLVGYIVSNPTGYDHWLYRWFVQDPQSGYIYFQTNTRENLHRLPPDYIENLSRIYSPDWVRAYLEGEWEFIDEGTPVFPLFQKILHVKEVEWNPRRPLHVGIDSGYRRPGVVWAQIDDQDRLLIFRSWAPREVTAHQLRDGILQRTAQWFPVATCVYYSGHDTKSRRDVGTQTTAEIFSVKGMTLRSRFAHVERGLEVMAKLLMLRKDNTPSCYVHPCNDILIRGFQGGYHYPKVKEDKDPKPHPVKTGVYDPLFDALRYIAIHHFSVTGERPSPAKRYAFRKELV